MMQCRRPAEYHRRQRSRHAASHLKCCCFRRQFRHPYPLSALPLARRRIGLRRSDADTPAIAVADLTSLKRQVLQSGLPDNPAAVGQGLRSHIDAPRIERPRCCRYLQGCRPSVRGRR